VEDLWIEVGALRSVSIRLVYFLLTVLRLKYAAIAQVGSMETVGQAMEL